MATDKYLQFLKRHIWLLAAFFIPLAIRSIPEILSWPYPLGLDTIRYIPIIESGQSLSSFFAFIQNQLFYSLGTLMYWLFGDGVLVIKIFGPLLMGVVATVMYLYARHGLGWNGLKSFMVSFLFSIYFVSLRNSWDLYAQSVGLIFLFSTLIVLRSSNHLHRYAFSLFFMLLTVLSHQLIAVILFFIMTLEGVRFLFNKSYKDLLFTFCSLGLIGSLFIFQIYSYQTGSIAIPLAFSTSDPAFAFALALPGLLVYGYGLLLPFAAVGLIRLKAWPLKYWIIWCSASILLLVAFPSLPLYQWLRWYYLLVYPLLFFAVDGLDRLYGSWSNKQHRIKRLLPKALSIVYVCLLLALSGFYLSVEPENQIGFFTSDLYLTYFPSSMLQNTVSVKDSPYLIDCFEWLNDNAGNDSAVVMHYAIFDFAKIYVKGPVLVDIVSPSMYSYLQNQTSVVTRMISKSIYSLDCGNSTVYTIWWVSGRGWYGISSLPSNYTEVYKSGEFAVYTFNLQ